MKYRQKFDIEDIFNLIQQEGISNKEEIQLVIDNMNVLPPSEIVKLVSYMKNVRSVDYLKKYVIPNLRHIQDKKEKENEDEDLEL